ncbi:MAG: hypothetical protein ACQERO_00480 [Bacteroidota bacterium]
MNRISFVNPDYPSRNLVYDDLREKLSGHFVVLQGYSAETGEGFIANLIKMNSTYNGTFYKMKIDSVINDILLGIVTYAASLIIITPKKMKYREYYIGVHSEKSDKERKFITSLNNLDRAPLYNSLERGWGEFESNKPKLFNLVLLIFRTYDFSE